MPTANAAQTLDHEFLGIRAKLLEVAASLDRIDRAEGGTGDDPRLAQLRKALAMLAEPGARTDRAERFQLHFSDPYEEDWMKKFDLAGR